MTPLELVEAKEMNVWLVFVPEEMFSELMVFISSFEKSPWDQMVRKDVASFSPQLR